MHESDFQSNVTNAILERKASEMTASLSDSGNIVIVEIGDIDAAYTADEARELAQGIQCAADQRWTGDYSDIIQYLRDLADVVDGEKEVAEVERE